MGNIKISIVANANSLHRANIIYKTLANDKVNNINKANFLDYEFKFTITFIDKKEKFLFNSVDILIVIDNECLEYLGVIKENLPPIVFLFDGEFSDFVHQPVLQKIVLINNDFSSQHIHGVPKELLLSAPLNFQEIDCLAAKRTELRLVKKILYVLPQDEIRLYTAKNVISFFNFKPEYSVTILTDKNNQFLLKQISNDNIIFGCFDELNLDYILQKDLVIANNKVAKTCLCLGIPVFIVGENGLGGLVKTENIKDYYRTRFMGRIGGVYGEEVPLKLLELLLEEDIHYVNKLAKANSEIVLTSELVRYIGRSNLQSLEILNRLFIELHIKAVKMNDKTHFTTLYVKSFSNVKAVNTSNSGTDEAILIDSDTGKILGALGYEEARLFNNCQDYIKISSLHSSFPDFEIEDINSFLRQLGMEGVLGFHIINSNLNGKRI